MFTKVTLIAVQEESRKNAGPQNNIGSKVDENEGSSAKKQKVDFTDLRKSKEKYEDTFPDFHLSNIEHGWYSKICYCLLKASSVPYPLLTSPATLAITHTEQYYVTCHPQYIKTLLRINQPMTSSVNDMGMSGK